LGEAPPATPGTLRDLFIVTALGGQRGGQAMGLNVFMLFTVFGLGSLLFGAALPLGFEAALALFSLVQLGAAVVLVFAGAVSLVPRIGREFMPPLNEGDLMFMPVTDPAISLPQAIAIAKKQNEAIQQFPEVASVVAKIARAETSTDPAPLNMTETIVSLKSPSAWR